MRKQFITGAMVAALFSASALPSFAGGVANSDVEAAGVEQIAPAVAGGLSGPVTLALLGLIVGAVVVAGDSN